MFGLLDYLKLGAGLLAGIALFSVYDRLIDDPMVRREALRGYVLTSERDALASQLAIERQRALAAAQTAEEARKRLAALSEANRTNREQKERAIDEDNRADDGAPRVTTDDDRWLRDHR